MKGRILQLNSSIPLKCGTGCLIGPSWHGPSFASWAELAWAEFYVSRIGMGRVGFGPRCPVPCLV